MKRVLSTEIRPTQTRVRSASGLLAAVLALLSIVLQPMLVAANGWCRSDPSFIVEDHIIHVDVASLESIFQVTTGPIKVKLRVPQGTRAGLYHVDNGFGYGYDIDIVKVDRWDDPGPDDPIRMEVVVLVPATGERLPVLVTVSDDSGVMAEKPGQTKDWIKVRTHI